MNGECVQACPLPPGYRLVLRMLEAGGRGDSVVLGSLGLSFSSAVVILTIYQALFQTWEPS